jgi:CRP-like cAMP-binding protein
MDNALFEIIRRSELFSDLSDDELKNLLNIVELIELHAGQILFAQNDDTDSMYLLLQGDLVASRVSSAGETKILGYVRAGEIVGEMGLISYQPRSLTISALS